MHEPTPTNPSPTAVPWTPDMMTQQPAAPTAAPSPVASPMPMAAPIPAQQPAPLQPNYQPAPQQTFQPPLQSHVQPSVRSSPSQHAQPFQQAAHPTQSQPYQNPAQPNPPQQMQQPHYVPPAPQYGAQPSPPPMLAAQRQGIHAGPLQQPSQQASKSLVGKFLKRAPKTQAMPESTAEVPTSSGSFLNKSFLLGTVAGFIGAFALTMVLNMFAAEPAQQVQSFAGPAPATAVVPVAQNSPAGPASNPAQTQAGVEGGTFIDNAIATDAP